MVVPVAFNFVDWSSRRFTATTTDSSAGPSNTIDNYFNSNINNSSDITGTVTGNTKP